MPRDPRQRNRRDWCCGADVAVPDPSPPRQRPPFPAQVGPFGRPTLCNNLETLYWVRDIVEKGPEWFTGQGRNGRKGLRTFSVSGRVRDPGVKLAPAGI